MRPTRLTRLTRSIELIIRTMTVAAAVAGVGQSQTTIVPAAAEAPASLNKTPVEIINHKIGSEYYPMLDRPNSMSAEMGICR